MDNDGTVNAEQLGQILDGLTPRRIRQLVEEGIIPRAARGRYPVIESIVGYIRYLKRETRAASVQKHDDRFRQARADVHEIEALEKLGKLMDFNEAAQATMGPLNAFLAALDACEVRIATDYGRDQSKIRALYREHVGGAREVFADDLGKCSEVYRSLARRRKAAPKKKPRRVGRAGKGASKGKRRARTVSRK